MPNYITNVKITPITNVNMTEFEKYYICNHNNLLLWK